MTVPDEAVEAAAKAHQVERSKLGYSNWDELNDMGKEWRLDHMRHALAAAAPFITAKLEAEVAYQMARAAYFKYAPEIDEDPEGVAQLLTAMRKARDARNAA